MVKPILSVPLGPVGAGAAAASLPVAGALAVGAATQPVNKIANASTTLSDFHFVCKYMLPLLMFWNLSVTKLFADGCDADTSGWSCRIEKDET